MFSPQSTLAAVAHRYLVAIFTMFLAASALTVFAAAPARAADCGPGGGITYSVDPASPAAEATVTGYNSACGSQVIIPDTIRVDGNDNNYTVTAIGYRAFEYKQLTSVALPNSITTIGGYAFARNALTSVTLPDALTTIGGYAFSDNGLTSVTLPDALTALGAFAFSGNALTSVTLPDALTAIGYAAFSGNALTSVTLPDALTTIGGYAFSDNELTSVTLPDTLTTIGQSAFGINALTSVTLPDTLTTIGGAAFESNALTSVTLPDTLTALGAWAFRDNALTSVTLPTTLTTIGRGAFHENNDLTQVRFTGPAPTTITGTDDDYPSLGTAEGLNVEFPARYPAQDGQPGYTTPLWRGYTTKPACTVSFDTDDGAAVDPVTVWSGAMLELPTSPARQGYIFTGWFTTPDLATQFDPSAPLACDVTVYAGWKPTSVPATPLTPTAGSLSSGSLDDFLPAGYGS